jgi:hypothetical protein
LVSPVPEPQRRLPSEKLEQTSPAVQSSSLEQVSHSSPLLPQEPSGRANASTSPNPQKRLTIVLSSSFLRSFGF